MKAKEEVILFNILVCPNMIGENFPNKYESQLFEKVNPDDWFNVRINFMDEKVLV